MAKDDSEFQFNNKAKALLRAFGWGVFAMFLFGSIIYTSPLLASNSFLGNTTPFEAATLMSNFTLTFLLVMIYTWISNAERVQADESEQQREILKAQKDTQKEQQKLFKANHQPLIRELDWQPFEVNGKDGLCIECINKRKWSCEKSAVEM